MSIQSSTKSSTASKTPQSSTKMSQPVPDAAAPPSKVREFISHLLQEREIPQTDIQDIIPKWKIGSGREMRGYDPAMYLEIFGAEYGWIIYREVKLRIHEEKCQNFNYKYRWETIASALAIITTSAIYTLTCEIGALALWVAVYTAVFGGGGLVIALGVIFFSGTPEESIEGDLRECRKVGGAKKE